jgi:RNA polymerase sigma-70 factor (ECF subfamily)
MQGLDVYEILVREHEGMLFSYVLSIVGDTGLAEDVAQEAFVQAYRKLDTLRNKDSFAPWLRTIARNIAYAELRRKGREVPTDPEIIQGMEDVYGRLDDTTVGDTWQERARALRTCFEALPDRLRSACGLHYFEDKKTDEVASLLKIGLNAVLKRLERARKAIRRCVEKRLGLEIS